MTEAPQLQSMTPCQATALDILKRQGNVFLTGAAGTGKSYLLGHYLKGTSIYDFPIVASTGAAAVLIGGRTFHSFFGVGIFEGGERATIARALHNPKVIRRLNAAHCVIIDEISMLSGLQLSIAETIARRARRKNEPWGGLRIIAVGDFAQLPPINKEGEEKDWAFAHPVWQESGFVPAVLSTVVRTTELEFLKILNFVREGVVNDEVRRFLDARMTINPKISAPLRGRETRGIGLVECENAEATRLYPHRAQAEEHNLRRLGEIRGPLRTFPTQYMGSGKYLEAVKRSAPIPAVLTLKEGALIMMRKNDLSARMQWVNGSLGVVARINDDFLDIALLSGGRIQIGRETFSSLDGDGTPVASATNFPVTLAWAATIHKAQGASLDRLIVDLGELWEPGQAYVALSRARSAAGLFIERWHPSSIRVEPLVTEFYNSLMGEMKRYVPRPLFVVPERKHVEQTQHSAVFRKKPRQISKEQRVDQIAHLLSRGISPQKIADIQGIKIERVVLYIEKLVEAGSCPDIRYLLPYIPAFTLAMKAFAEHGTERLRPAFDALEGKVSFNALRVVRCIMIQEERKKVTQVSAKSQPEVLYF